MKDLQFKNKALSHSKQKQNLSVDPRFDVKAQTNQTMVTLSAWTWLWGVHIIDCNFFCLKKSGILL
jgi:hypothetical protein